MAEAERLREGLRKITGNPKIQFNIQEIKQPEIDAMLLAQGVADQLAGQEKGLTVESEQNQRDIERLRRENERLREECIER